MDKKSEMMEYHSYDEVPLMLSAKDIAALLKMPMSSVYFMFYAVDFPTVSIGSRKLVRKEKLFAWLEKHENDITYLMNANAGERRRELIGQDSMMKERQQLHG